MAAGIGDKFKKSYSFLSKTLSSGIDDTTQTIPLNNATNVPTDTAVDFIMDRVDANGNRTPSSREIGTAVVSGANLTNAVRGRMSTTAQDHDNGAVVEFTASAQTHNDMVDGILQDHGQAGQHKTLTDDNGNEWIERGQTASAVNQVKVSNAATGNAPVIEANGGDTNIGLTLTPKGSGNVAITKRFDGWVTGLPTPNTVTYNGNRNYSVVFNSVDLTSYISNGMRLKATRTVTAPTQCTSLNGTTQYYSKSSPSGMTFTDDFVVSAWVKLSSYGAVSVIASRYNGTSGWDFSIDASGRLQLVGYNAAAGNNSYVLAYQSLPLNKWVHVAAQLDMSTFTATTTTSYIMMDGIDIPASVGRAGTNPTALIQAGNLEIGGRNGGLLPWPGKIAQVAIYNAKVTQATITASVNQTPSGSETSLISAYSFNNTINDLNTSNANNLTANGSAVATNADSPFAGGANASTANTAGTTEFGEVFNVSFSTNTTLTVQVPDGHALPTSGGISALAYSTQAVPLGWPAGAGGIRELAYLILYASQTTTSTTPTAVLGLTTSVYVPAGRKVRVRAVGNVSHSLSAATYELGVAKTGASSANSLFASSNRSVSGTVPQIAIAEATDIPTAAGSQTYLTFWRANDAGTLTAQRAETGDQYATNLLVELVS